MKAAVSVGCAMVLYLAAVARPQAAEPGKGAAGGAPKKVAPAAKGDPTGTWTWTAPGRDGQTRQRSATLKRDGDKVTGTISGRNGDQPIEEGKIKEGEVSFKVVRERDGRKMTQQFVGKIDADAIKGTMTVNRGDGERSLPWEAKRGAAPAPAAAAAPPAGPTPAAAKK
jgi:hypothetical protein